MFFPHILITIAGIKSRHSLDRFKKCFLTSCPNEHTFPVPLRQKEATTGSIEMRRAQQRRWIFEIVMMAADELHTLCSYRWISRELVHSNSWRFVRIFEALLVRFSSNALTTSPFHRRTSLHQHSQQ